MDFKGVSSLSLCDGVSTTLRSLVSIGEDSCLFVPYRVYVAGPWKIHGGKGEACGAYCTYAFVEMQLAADGCSFSQSRGPGLSDSVRRGVCVVLRVLMHVVWWGPTDVCLAKKLRVLSCVGAGG